MVVQVTVVDGDAASDLMGMLRSEVGVGDLSFDQAHHLVRIGIAKSPDETLVEVLNLVETWLGAAGLPPTEVDIDERRYLLAAAASPRRGSSG